MIEKKILKDALSKYLNYPHDFSLGRNLLIMVTNYIIEQGEEPKENEIYISYEPFITLMEFYEKTHICSPSAFARIIAENANESWVKNGSISKAKKYIQLNESIKFLSKYSAAPLIMGKALKYLNEQKQNDDS